MCAQGHRKRWTCLDSETQCFPGAPSTVLWAAGCPQAQGLLPLGTDQLSFAEKKQVLKDKKADSHQTFNPHRKDFRSELLLPAPWAGGSAVGTGAQACLLLTVLGSGCARAPHRPFGRGGTEGCPVPTLDHLTTPQTPARTQVSGKTPCGWLHGCEHMPATRQPRGPVDSIT